MYKYIILFIVLLVNIVPSGILYGRNLIFKHLTTDDGLSQFTVNSLYADETGALWIGTREGLNRYDGNRVETFKMEKDNPYSLFSNSIAHVTGDGKGRYTFFAREAWLCSISIPCVSQL